MRIVKDTESSCCNCNRQKKIDGTAWIYCQLYKEIEESDVEFDETGEKDGCSGFAI